MTVGSGPDDVPVLLIPSEGEHWLEVREMQDDGPGFWPVIGSVAEAARTALSLGQGQKLGARIFVCHPDDLSVLDRAARKFKDGHGYARAFAHDANGNFVVNARFKEVSLPPSGAFDPVSVALLAAQAQTQMMLEQVQIQLADVQEALDYLKEVDNVDLAADILGNAALVDHLWRALQRDGSVPETDWDEAQHLGAVLSAQHRKVLGRLAAFRKRLAFTTLDGARAAQNVRVRDVENLFQLERFVYRALCQHFDLSMTVRRQRREELSLPLQRADRVKAEHLRASEEERHAFAAISPNARRELNRTVVRRGVFAIIEQGQTIRDGRDHVARISRTVPATVAGVPPVMRLTESGQRRPGLPATTARNADSDLDL